MSRKAHSQDNRVAEQKRRAKALKNYDAFEGKRDLLRIYETMGIENDYVKSLRRRVASQQVRLVNRGSILIDTHFNACR